jgi:hypothetical protein
MRCSSRIGSGEKAGGGELNGQSRSNQVPAINAMGSDHVVVSVSYPFIKPQLHEMNVPIHPRNGVNCWRRRVGRRKGVDWKVM